MRRIILLLLVAVTVSGCERIETGEVGLRVGFDKQVNTNELLPGTFNQTLVGSVLTFPVRDIALTLDDMHPQTADNSTLQDMDITVIYSINPAAVGELYTTKSRAFHARDESNDIILMYNYLTTVARSAAYKAAATHDALKTISARAEIEADTAKYITAALADEKLASALNITKVQVRNIQPAANIIASANAVITAQNNLKAKQVEVDIARKEAERLSLLSSNSQNVRYMEAKALQDIAEGVREGKVQSIVVPYDFKGIINVGR
ncbi:MAG: SPFH domain-containing protein [Gammaproteobacteria bacterium]|nr:SPFH domain-containing protein [Gammaproteobacteria bacterium]MBU1447932.1 SPFH domain-containing protein [Gammaproteobacteria bacterium]